LTVRLREIAKILTSKDANAVTTAQPGSNTAPASKSFAHATIQKQAKDAYVKALRRVVEKKAERVRCEQVLAV